ncbi:MAG: hypothetical protein LLG44_14390 [Chloroflexi bacterium]|nr:hypothetical protein [Chloroflexota bacterium]
MKHHDDEEKIAALRSHLRAPRPLHLLLVYILVFCLLPPSAASADPATYVFALPAVYKNYAEVPAQPQVQASAVADDGSFTISWSALTAEAYTVQESTNITFSSGLREVCLTSELACLVRPVTVGVRYYRVRGRNSSYYGEWSAPLTVSVPIRGGILVDTHNRQAVADFYYSQYVISPAPAINWTGSQDTCAPGVTSQAFRAAVLKRLNYFRAMAGVPADIIFTSDANRKAQAAALVMSRNNTLTHDVTDALACYSQDARDGAGASNLFLGVYGWDAIHGYLFDYGDGNYAVGHRRWILLPQTREMGAGDIPPSGNYQSANALLVFDAHMVDPRPLTRDEFVAWPAPGYVPYQVVFARWSFSYPNADFSQASITLTSAGHNVPVAVAPVINGYGENTLVWIPNGMSNYAAWPQVIADTTYSVTVRNVIIGGQSRDFSYSVTIFNPGAGVQGASEAGAAAPLALPPE